MFGIELITVLLSIVEKTLPLIGKWDERRLDDYYDLKSKLFELDSIEPPYRDDEAVDKSYYNLIRFLEVYQRELMSESSAKA